jgi:hypothetical protein
MERALIIRIDHQPSGDTLTGTYSEIITGLVAQPLTASGPLSLRRVSAVDSLQ